MRYIYSYTNKINGKSYVGQTNNIDRRRKEHKSSAFNPNDSTYDSLFHKKIREYELDNFIFEILENIQGDDIEISDEREKFWIKEKKSHVSENGYNLTRGGQSRGDKGLLLSREQIKEIKQLIKKKTPFGEICEKFNISKPFVSSINTGVYFKDENEEYPLCQYFKTNDEYQELYYDIKFSDMSLADIAKKYKLSYSMVKKINSGTLRKGLSDIYPIREKNAPMKQRADFIKNLLFNTDKTIHEISLIAKASNETVRRVNRGMVFKDPDISYPIRNL